MGSASVQGAMWGAKPREWADLAEPVSLPAWRAVFSAAGVKPGTRLLDMGCGAGGAFAVAREMGAQVTGIDASESLAEIARERNPGARIEVGDIEELPFEDESFDIVTGFNSFQFADDPVAALREARRVCRRDGRVCVTIWSTPDRCESVRTTFRAVMELLPAPSGPQPPSISEPGVLEGLLDQAGLTPVSTGEVEIPFEFSDAESAWRTMSSAGIISRAEEVVGVEAVKQAIVGSLGPFTKPDGSVRQTNHFRYVIAAPR